MNKEICKRCMAVEKVASFENDKQEGKPCPWNQCGSPECDSYDDDHWDKGMIHCPHKRQGIPLTVAYHPKWCLRFVEQLCAKEHILLPWDEIPERV